MSDEQPPPTGGRSGRRSGGRAARQAARSKTSTETQAYLTRTMAPFEVVSAEGLETIEHAADTILEETGIDFRDYPSALTLLADAGADVEGERVRFPRGMCRQIIQGSAPSTYTQHGRNPVRNVQVGGDATVLVPAYGSPFVRDLDDGRRYGTIGGERSCSPWTSPFPSDIWTWCIPT